MAVITSLLLTRHGEAHCNLAGVAGGEKTCTGLTERGRTQVRLLAERLYAEALPDVLYAAPRRRVQESAQILSGMLGLPVHIEPGLRARTTVRPTGVPGEIKAAFGGPRLIPTGHTPPARRPGISTSPARGSSSRTDTAARRAVHPDRRTWRDRGRRRDLAARPLPGFLDASRLRIRSRIDYPLEHAAQSVRPGNMDARRPERHPAPGWRTVTRSAILLQVSPSGSLRALRGNCGPGGIRSCGSAMPTARSSSSNSTGSRSKHDREVHAYRHWTTALGPSAPRRSLRTAQP